MKRNAAAPVCVALALALALSGCVTPPGRARQAALFAEAVPLCTLLANANANVGKRVLVRGYVNENFHGREFDDDNCDRGTLPLNFLRREIPRETARQRALRMRLDGFAAQFRHKPSWVPVVYSGVLTDHSPALIVY